MWRVSKWARLSNTKPGPAGLPPLGREVGCQTAYTHEEKAALLAERFFPSPPADLSDIGDTTFEGDGGAFEIRPTVKPSEVTQILHDTGAWKAPGNDLLPTGFLRACGEPLAVALADIATASFALEYFPKRFRSADAVVLNKPGKSKGELHTPGAYRPIALLSTLGKVIETAMGRRVADAAETRGLLPEGQMGNRPGRSTELAVTIVQEAVYTAWSHGAVASLLQLDIKGAFDTVNHLRLLDTLRGLGFPLWVVRWVRSVRMTGTRLSISVLSNVCNKVIYEVG